MNKSKSVTSDTAAMTCSHLGPSAPASSQVFGYAPPTRLYKLGKRTLVYRLPKDTKRFAVSIPLVFVLALLFAVFVTGYVNGGRVPLKSEGRVLPTAVVPNITFHRLITISAVHGVINLPANNVPGELV